jgi:uncharacterized protein (TIGR02996 family)
VLRNRQLEARIAEDPDDLAGYRVYGDWLLENGDPRGEVMLRSADRRAFELQGGDSEQLERLEAEELRLEREWVEDLGLTSHPFVTLEWRLGFIHCVHVELVAADVPEEVHALFQHPTAALVRNVSFGCGLWSGGRFSFEGAAAFITDHAPRSLRTISLGDDSRCGFTLGDLRPMFEHHARVERLSLAGRAQRNNAPRHLGALTSLTLSTNEDIDVWVRELVEDTWLHLRQLRLECHDPEALRHATQLIDGNRDRFPTLGLISITGLSEW